MRHGIALSILLTVAAVSEGALSKNAMGNTVSVGHRGSFEVMDERAPDPFVLEKEKTGDDSPFEVDHNLDGKLDTPFEVDPTVGGKPSMTKLPDPASAVQDGKTNDSPFVLDPKGGAPPPQPSLDDMPYPFLKEPASEGETPGTAPVPVGDSPFVMDTQAKAATKPAAAENSPFVMDTQMQAHSAPASSAAVVTNTAKAKTQVKGAQTIVRSMDAHPGPQPATTHMEVRLPAEMATTTGIPTAPSPFKLELGESMMEVKRHPRRGPIELVRPDMKSSESVSLLAQEALPASREIAAVTPDGWKRLMRNEEAHAFVAQGSKPAEGTEEQPDTKHVHDAIDAEKDSTGTNNTMAISAENAKLAVTSASLPSAIAVPVSRSGGGGGASDPTVPLAAKNDSLSAPESIFNATSAEVPLNVTNITANLPKVVSARGAVISIFMGLVVTLGFFSVLLCLLQAGLAAEKGNEKEPPRQTRTYRQLLASQMSQEQQSEPAQLPSADRKSVV